MTIDEKLAEIHRLASLGLYAEAYELRTEVMGPPRGPGIAYKLVEIRREFVHFDLYCKDVAAAMNRLLQ